MKEICEISRKVWSCTNSSRTTRYDLPQGLALSHRYNLSHVHPAKSVSTWRLNSRKREEKARSTIH